MAKERLLDVWYGLSLKRKLYVLMISMTLFMAIAILLNIKVSYVFIDDIRQLMDDNISSYKFQESFRQEREAFADLVRDWTVEKEEKFQLSSKETLENVEILPYNYEKIGEERYAITWSIRNSYEEYQKQRDKMIALKGSGKAYISELYKTYEMQD